MTKTKIILMNKIALLSSFSTINALVSLKIQAENRCLKEGETINYQEKLYEVITKEITQRFDPLHTNLSTCML